MSTTVSIIAATGSVATLVLWLLRFFFGSKMAERQTAKMQEKVDELTTKMSKVIRKQPFDFKLYARLGVERKLLNRKIARTKRVLGAK